MTDETLRALEREAQASNDRSAWARVAAHAARVGDVDAHTRAWLLAGAPGRDPRKQPVPGDVVENETRGSRWGNDWHELRRYEVLPLTNSYLLTGDPKAAEKYVERRLLMGTPLTAFYTHEPITQDEVKIASWKAWARDGRVLRRMPVELAKKKAASRVTDAQLVAMTDDQLTALRQEAYDRRNIALVRKIDDERVSDRRRLERKQAHYRALGLGEQQDNPPRGDERLRDLERRAAQGDLEAQVALEAARLRTTDPVDVLNAEVDERVAQALGPGASLNEWARLKRDLARAVGWCLDAAPYERERTSQVPELGDVTADVQGVTFSWFAKHAWTGETVAPRAVAEAWIDRMAITRRPARFKHNPDERTRGLERRGRDDPQAKLAAALAAWRVGQVVPPDDYDHLGATWRYPGYVVGTTARVNTAPDADRVLEVYIYTSPRPYQPAYAWQVQKNEAVLSHLDPDLTLEQIALHPDVQHYVAEFARTGPEVAPPPRQNPGDEGWRAAERAWAASSGDAALEAAYLAAWERAGSPGRSPLRDPAPGDVVDCVTGKGGTVYRFEVASVTGARMVRRFLGEVVNGTLVWPKHGSRGHTPKVAVSSWRRAAKRVVRRMADHPIQQNPDDAYRAAERGAQYGDPQAQAAALTARLRAGDLDPRVVQLAAQLGHPAAGLLMPPDNVWRGPGPIELAREFMGDEKLVLWLADCAERAPFPTSRGVGARAADEVLRLAREWAQGGGKFCGLTDRMQHAQRALSNQAARRTAVPGAVQAARARNTVLDYIGNLGDKGGPLPAFQALATLNEALEAAGMVAYHRAVMEAPLGTAYIHVGQARSAEERWQNLRLAQHLLGEAP